MRWSMCLYQTGRIIEECADAEQKPDMYILDIEMPGMDGLAVAKQIRETDSKALLVFLTSYTKYMPSVFEVVTFDFIPKPSQKKGSVCCLRRQEPI